jgi:2-polyprenyl-3-methyl-5-hydroxy-6-metoxy-1,4-benzoquinol methylase
MRPYLELDGRFSLVECSACGLVSTRPELSAADVLAFYPPSYYGRRNRRFTAALERLVPWFRARRADALERLATKGPMLDVGCGRGYLPAILRQRGWDAHGLELTDAAAEHARDALGVPVSVGTLEESAFPPAAFEAVVVWHVLEHIVDPAGALRRAHDLLKPGGLLLVAVPNAASLQARVAGRHWFHLDVPRHYHHFRVGVLLRMLRETGFRVVRTSHFVFEQNPYGWIQSLYNMLGFRPNLLYEILKDESARTEPHPFRAYPVQSSAIVALLPVVAAAGFTLFFVETLLRRGGTVEIHARRDDP